MYNPLGETCIQSIDERTSHPRVACNAPAAPAAADGSTRVRTVHRPFIFNVQFRAPAITQAEIQQTERQEWTNYRQYYGSYRLHHPRRKRATPTQ